jgi:hypothetical protein
MDVSSVKSQSVQAQQAVKRVDSERQATQNKESTKQLQAKAEPPSKPSPVINAQGQTTGRLLNVTA